MRSNRFFKWALVFSLIIVLIAGMGFVSAKPQAKERIYDFANLLTREEKIELEKLSAKYSSRRKTDYVILTTSDSMGKDIVEYMEDFYDDEGLGYDKPHGNTAILTIDLKNRDLYLAGFYRAEKYLSDDRLDLIRDKITPDLSRGNYYDGFASFIKTSYRYMGVRPGVNPENILFKLWFQVLVSLGLAGILLGIMSFNSGGKTTVKADTYQDFANSRIISRGDTYLRTDVSKHKKPSSNASSSMGGSSGGGGRGGGGVSRGGHSHSGSRGKF